MCGIFSVTEKDVYIKVLSKKESSKVLHQNQEHRVQRTSSMLNAVKCATARVRERERAANMYMYIDKRRKRILNKSE